MPKPARRTGRKPAAVRRRIRKPVASKAPRRKEVLPNERLPELDLIYDTAPVGLAFLSPDCRYVHINQRLTEICGISVADHIGRSVRETVPQVAEQVEQLVEAVLLSGEPITGVEVPWAASRRPQRRPRLDHELAPVEEFRRQRCRGQCGRGGHN